MSFIKPICNVTDRGQIDLVGCIDVRSISLSHLGNRGLALNICKTPDVSCLSMLGREISEDLLLSWTHLREVTVDPSSALGALPKEIRTVHSGGILIDRLAIAD